MSAAPWPGLFTWLSMRINGDRSRQESIERQYAETKRREEEALMVKLREEAVRYAELIRGTLTRKGVCYRYTKTERQEVVEKIQEVDFVRPYFVSSDVIKLKIDTRHLPRGVGLGDLENEEILRLLSYNCKHRVTVRGSHDTGFWYWIERMYGVGGIPTHLSFEEAMESRPATLAGERLAFPVGIGENKKIVWRTLPQVVNILVAGSPDRGKSNFVNGVICTLLKFNRPDQLRLMLVDLKGGLEFNFYAGLTEYLLTIPKPRKTGKTVEEPAEEPPLEAGEPEYDPENDGEVLDQTERASTGDPEEPEFVAGGKNAERIPAFIERREHVPAALSWLIGEAERRMEAIRKANCKKISEYNQKHSHKPMPHILLVIDEWADIKLTPKIGARSEERLINITNRARAVGIHTIVCTQSPNRDVLSIRIKNALNSRMIFGTADQYMSAALLGNYDATKLETRGRGIFVSARDRMELQAPYIPNELVERIVSEAGGGNVTKTEKPKDHDVTPLQVYEWAIRENDGRLAVDEIFAEFAPRKFKKKEAVNFAREHAGERVEIDGTLYVVQPGRSFPRPVPARLLPADVYTANAAQNAAQNGNSAVPASAELSDQAKADIP